MAIIQMWPQNQGLRNSVSFDGRIYSSIPGVPIPVPDFDAPVLQANGWTTYATIAGKNTITMLSPAGLTTISFDGRQYSTLPGVSIEVPPFDAMILQANRWTIVAGALQPLTLSAAAFHVGDPQGTVVGTILGASSGSTITFNSLSAAGALQIAGTSVQVGPTPSGSPSTVTFNLVETLTGATNTPNQTNGFSVSELVAIPVNVVVPTITGTAQVGQTLTASTGAWTNSPTSYAYQWNSSAGGAIPGATASTYVPVTGDIGNTLTVSVVATNSGGSSSSATSAATSAVAAAGSVPANTVLPTLSGTPQVGQTLTATNGTWTNSPTSFTYQWNRAGSAISGATASAYVPVSADIGNTLTVSVTATNGFGSSTPATSVATGAVIDIIPTNSSAPTISGTAQVGQTLTATTGTWTHNPTSFTYQWNGAGTAIAGATASTYVPVAADVGNTLTVAIVATNSGGSSFAATSPATVSVIDMIPTNSSVPTISGTAQVGQTLTATTGTWTHNPTSFTYQMESRGDGDRRGNRFRLCSRRGGCRQHADGLRRRHEFRRVELRRDQSGHGFRHRHHSDEQLCPNDLWNRPGGPDVDGDNWRLDAQSNLLHLSMESRGDGDRRGNRFHLCSRRGRCRQHADGLRRRHEFRRVEFRRDQSDHSFRHRHHPDKFGGSCHLWNRPGRPDVDGDNWRLDAQSNLLHLSDGIARGRRSEGQPLPPMFPSRQMSATR